MKPLALTFQEFVNPQGVKIAMPIDAETGQHIDNVTECSLKSTASETFMTLTVVVPKEAPTTPVSSPLTAEQRRG